MFASTTDCQVAYEYSTSMIITGHVRAYRTLHLLPTIASGWTSTSELTSTINMLCLSGGPLAIRVVIVGFAFLRLLTCWLLNCKGRRETGGPPYPWLHSSLELNELRP